MGGIREDEHEPLPTMATLRPFKALRPRPDVVEQVASVPYDVVDREEAAALASGNPLSFLHVSRSEIDLPADVNPYADTVYAKAAETFARLRQDGVLVEEEKPCLYLYRLQMGEQVQVGIAATFSVDEYDDDRIKKHEKTRKDKEDDRTRHIVTLRAQTGPVFLTHRSHPALQARVEQAMAAAPLYEFVAPDGIRHTMWRVEETEPFVACFAEIPALYIADGHHRAASASRTRARLRDEAGDAWTGQEEGNYFLAVAFPADQLRILPYNRVVRDLNGHGTEDFLGRVQATFGATPDAAPSPDRAQACSMHLAGKWYGLDLSQAAAKATTPADGLDVAVLQAELLAPVLGVQDPRTDKRIDFVGGIRGTGELEKAVDGGRAAVAFSMYPTSVDQLMAISDAGQIMPPKSTWFEPKLRDALVIHTV